MLDVGCWMPDIGIENRTKTNPIVNFQ